MVLKKMKVGLILVVVLGLAGVAYHVIKEERLKPETLSVLSFPMKEGRLHIRALRSPKNGDWLQCYYSANDHEKTAADTLWGRGLMKLSLYQGLAFMEAAQEGPTDLFWNLTERIRLESAEPGVLSLYIDDSLVDVSEEMDETRMFIEAGMIASAIRNLDEENSKARK